MKVNPDSLLYNLDFEGKYDFGNFIKVIQLAAHFKNANSLGKMKEAMSHIKQHCKIFHNTEKYSFLYEYKQVQQSTGMQRT